jgi:hypothetical protein
MHRSSGQGESRRFVANPSTPYRGVFKVIDTANDYIEAWRQAAAARRMLQGGIIFVLSTETREDPKPLNRKSCSNVPVGRVGRA